MWYIRIANSQHWQDLWPPRARETKLMNAVCRFALAVLLCGAATPAVGAPQAASAAKDPQAPPAQKPEPKPEQKPEP